MSSREAGRLVENGQRALPRGRCALLALAFFDYELLPDRRFGFDWLVGPGSMRYRTRYPIGFVYDEALDHYIPTGCLRMEVQHRFHFTGGSSLRAYVSDRVFVDSELRLGLSASV